MVPPLIITFVEMAEVTSPARKKPLKVYAVMALAPWIGTAWRYLSVYTPIPTYITFPCALVCLCVLMELIQSFHLLRQALWSHCLFCFLQRR